MDGLAEISDLIQAFDFHKSLSILNVTLGSGGIGEFKRGSERSELTHISQFSNQISTWTAWVSSVFLLLVSLVGLPLNGATVVIFWRRKKLRSLVNFELLLDCLSHIFLCLICVPIHIVTSVWKSPLKRMPWSSVVQQVVGNFANLFGLLLTLSISILRYRRLCWKKKDKFSVINAIKWSGSSGSFAIGFTLVPCFVAQPQQVSTLTHLYSVKLALVLISILMVFFCYMRVIQRVWSSGATQEEKVMDVTKLKKSRVVRMLATFHSCVQIVLVVMTLTPYLYEEAIEALKDHNRRGEEKDKGTSYNQTDRLLAITINYTLLILGTPLAYIASCHRFREQFTSSILIILGHSPAKPLYLTRQSTAPSTQLPFRSDSQKSSIKTRTSRHQNNNNNYCPFHYNFSRDSSLIDKNKGQRDKPEPEKQQPQLLTHSRIVEHGDEDIVNELEHVSTSRRKSLVRRGSILDSLKPCNTPDLPSSSSSSSSSSSPSDHTLDSTKSTNGFTTKISTRSSASSSFSSQNTTTMGTLSSTGSAVGSPSVNVTIALPIDYPTIGGVSTKRNFCANLRQEYHKTVMMTRTKKSMGEFGQIV